MMKKAISFTILCMLIPFSRCQFCQIRISRNETRDFCCADYEKRENDCIACSKGYTSDMGHNCKPCPKNNYGERCVFKCSCRYFEVCDNVEGCVQASSTTNSFMYATSDTMQPVSDKTCLVINERGEKKKVCCSDFEEKWNGCRACLKGFTSDMGQNCRPCPNHSYGEKCDFVCSCTDKEMCDHVQGCVASSSTSSTSADATSFVDRTSSLRVTGTNEEGRDCSFQVLLSREITVYSALSVLVVTFGICLCFVVLKYKTLTRKNRVSINEPQNSSVPPQIQPHEIADRLYDIINEEDILDDRRIQQMQMSSNYIDVIHDSNTRDSCESNSFVNQNNPCQLLSIDQTQNQENNLKVDSRSLMSGNSSSSSDEYQWDSTQDYLNPYQPMIDIFPPEENKYLTIATAYSKDATTNV